MQKIYLTFDDGPSNITNQILNLLLEYNIHAIFFVLIENALKYPDLIKREIQEGHQIGLHSYSHISFFNQDKNSIRLVVGKSINILKERFNIIPKLFRPPWGTLTADVEEIAKQFNLTIMMWDIIRKDWLSGRVEKKAKNIIQKTFSDTNEKIIAMHDGWGNKKHNGSTINILKIIFRKKL